MMLHLIEPENYEFYRKDLDDMYRLRHKIFVEKKNWDVNSQDGMEKDEYDEKNAYYLIYKDEGGIVRGCCRFIEMTNPCLFDGCFREFLPNVDEFKRKGYWEINRFCVDTTSGEYYKSYMQKSVSKILLAGLVSFGIQSKKVECYLALTSHSFKKLNIKYGIFVCDLNECFLNGDRVCVWGFTSATHSFHKLTNELEKNIKLRVFSNIKCL